MEALFNIKNIANSLVYSVIGVCIYLVGFFAFDHMTPYHLWQEIIEKRNVALAIVVGSMTLGIAIIIAAAVNG